MMPAFKFSTRYNQLTALVCLSLVRFRVMESLNMQEINPSLPIIELTKLGVPAHLAPKIKQGSGELASIVLSITILIGGISTAICILCVRYKR